MFIRLHQEILPPNKDLYETALSEVNVSIKAQRTMVSIPAFTHHRQLSASRFILFDSVRNSFYSLSFNTVKNAPFPAPFKVKRLNLVMSGQVVIFDVINESSFFFAEIVVGKSLQIVKYDLTTATSQTYFIEQCSPSIMSSVMKRGALIDDSLYVFAPTTIRIAISSGLSFDLDDLAIVPLGGSIYGKYLIAPYSAPNSVFEIDRFHVLSPKFYLPSSLENPTVFIDKDILYCYDKYNLIECSFKTKLNTNHALPDQQCDKLIMMVEDFMFSLTKSGSSFELSILKSPKVTSSFLPKNLYLKRSILPSKVEAFVLICQGYLDASKIDFTLDDFVDNTCAFQLSGKWQHPLVDRKSLTELL